VDIILYFSINWIKVISIFMEARWINLWNVIQQDDASIRIRPFEEENKEKNFLKKLLTMRVFICILLMYVPCVRKGTRWRC
jgi:hypothetical protein